MEAKASNGVSSLVSGVLISWAVLVSESIIRQGIVIGGRRLVKREVNQKGQAHDVGTGHETPIAAVAAVVAIIPEHEVHAVGHDQFPVPHVRPHLHPPMGIDARVGVEPGGKLIAEVVLRSSLEYHIGLVLLLAIEENHAVLQTDVVAGNAHHPLDHVIGRVKGEVKDDDVSTVNRLVGQPPVPFPGCPVNGLVDQQEVTHQQRTFHRFGGNAEWLGHERQHKQGNDNHRQQRAKGVEEVGENEMVVVTPRRPGGDDGHSLCNRGRHFGGDAEEFRWGPAGQEPLPSARGSGAGACFRSLSTARRAASCSALFLVVPTPRASALGALPADNLTSTRKRLR